MRFWPRLEQGERVQQRLRRPVPAYCACDYFIVPFLRQVLKYQELSGCCAASVLSSNEYFQFHTMSAAKSIVWKHTFN